MKAVRGTLVAAVLALALAGCGGDPVDDAAETTEGTDSGGDYCALLEEARDALEPELPEMGDEPTRDSVQAMVEETLEPALEETRRLAGAAPEELDDEWTEVIALQEGMVDGAREWFSEEGWAAYEAASMEERFDLMFTYLLSPLEEFDESSVETITAHALEECGVDLR